MSKTIKKFDNCVRCKIKRIIFMEPIKLMPGLCSLCRQKVSGKMVPDWKKWVQKEENHELCKR